MLHASKAAYLWPDLVLEGAAPCGCEAGTIHLEWHESEAGSSVMLVRDGLV